MNVGKFRKKTVVIKAYQTTVEMMVQTLERPLRALFGNWIITDVHREFNSCESNPAMRKVAHWVQIEQRAG